MAAAALVLGLLAHASLAEGHHSIAGVYDGSRQLRLEGTVRQFDFVNPHPFISLEVRAADGTPELWTLEMDNRRELVELGFRDGTLKPGDRLVITGNAARRKPHALYVRTLERPSDGFSYEHHR